jgi:hypothetical protein
MIVHTNLSTEYSAIKNLPKECPGIHPNHKWLKLLDKYGKYEDLNVRFVTGADVIFKALQNECNGIYNVPTKKNSTLRCCKNCKIVQKSRILLKRLEHMASVQNVHDIRTLPQITDMQIAELK